MANGGGTLPGTAEALGGPIKDLYELLKKQASKKLAVWHAEKNLKEIYKQIFSYQKVKTIWQIDKEVNLASFYYPSKLMIGDEVRKINRLNQIPGENVVVKGTVGQGKSVFLRYLVSQELKAAKRIPIFLELRRLQGQRSIQSALLDELDTLGFNGFDRNMLDVLLSSGLIAIFLDGFDEIESSSETRVIDELERLVKKYQSTRFIVSSRPDSAIEYSPHFRIYELAPLLPRDHGAILRKLMDSKDQADSLNEVIQRSPTKISQLLTTPLMITLLVLVYKSEQKIPEQLSEFYEKLFEVLLFRHDKSKPGFVRNRRTELNERELQGLFEAFCFFSKLSNKSVFDKKEISDFSNKASDAIKCECKSDDFLSDLIQVTCLLLQEGFRYYFIHKSVQEYHAAAFIGGRTDEFVRKFYRAVDEDSFRHWHQELQFLKQIDKYRFEKFYAIPRLTEMLKQYCDEVDGNYVVNRELVSDFINQVRVVLPNGAEEFDAHFAFSNLGGFGDGFWQSFSLHLLTSIDRVLTDNRKIVFESFALYEQKKKSEELVQPVKALREIIPKDQFESLVIDRIESYLERQVQYLHELEEYVASEESMTQYLSAI